MATSAMAWSTVAKTALRLLLREGGDCGGDRVKGPLLMDWWWPRPSGNEAGSWNAEEAAIVAIAAIADTRRLRRDDENDDDEEEEEGGSMIRW